MSEKQYPLHHDHGTVTISRDVFESMTAELEHLRPMECGLELAEADRDAYKKKVEELKGELKDIADDRNEFKQLYSEQTEKLCIEKTNVDTLEQAWKQSQRAPWMTRANKAECEARGWYHSNAYIIKYDGLHNIKGVLYGKGFKRYPDEWMKLWIKIESLCLAKAKESDK